MCKVNSSLYSQNLSEPRREAGGQSHWIPNTDVYTTEDGLVVKAELAGMRREDLEISLEGNRLLISGQRPDGCRSPGSKFLVMEINYGAFECVIEIPPGYDPANARAAYQNGFLRVDVPAVAKPASKTVVVHVSETK
jgi:HSP20 family protein